MCGASVYPTTAGGINGGPAQSRELTHMEQIVQINDVFTNHVPTCSVCNTSIQANSAISAHVSTTHNICPATRNSTIWWGVCSISSTGRRTGRIWRGSARRRRLARKLSRPRKVWRQYLLPRGFWHAPPQNNGTPTGGAYTNQGYNHPTVPDLKYAQIKKNQNLKSTNILVFNMDDIYHSIAITGLEV